MSFWKNQYITLLAQLTLTTQDIKSYMKNIGHTALEASKVLSKTSTATKNAALLNIAKSVNAHRKVLLDANMKDVLKAKKNDLDAAMLDRLTLNDQRIDAIIEGLNQVAALPEPVGNISELETRPSGIQLGKMSAPIGVVGIIYESRPNVTIDAASLCLKAGNATILRGGSEAIESNRALGDCINIGLASSGLPSAAIQIIQTTDRAVVGELITMTEYIDVIIPRGGKSLIQRLSKDARVPLIKHLDGNCHVYIDCEADIQKALAVAINAKTHRYGVCNAMESLLVSKAVAKDILPPLIQKLIAKGVEVRGCAATCLLSGEVLKAAESDWSEEYLAPIVAVKIVSGIDEAIEHINRYGSKHTDSIVTENQATGHRFLVEVDSSSVMINASTRFADGFEYGLGAEIGISTDKIHARGPVGLKGLTNQKWVVFGDGHIRQ
ncbi:MAG: glutamate-5-semialdehyde dehydrogenase [Porticoccaceae bacterium]|nr:glutamate-5-semialdehyde dehydrogenase [Porticoccaceae bacterium]MDG1473953.1 glutamate-5-semialdehyde dehydrogenase [Porticoccaceae bacterium]